jgi:hypothetical protein
VVFADGSVHFLRNTLSAQPGYEAMGTRAAGDLIANDY